MADQYKPGDVVNGHRLTEDNRWVPVEDAVGRSSSATAEPTAAMPSAPYPTASATGPTATASAKGRRRAWLIPLLVGVVAFIVGIGIGNAGKGAPTAASGSASTATVTVTAPGLGTSSAATVTAPGPTVTITATASAPSGAAANTSPGGPKDNNEYLVNKEIAPGQWRCTNAGNLTNWQTMKQGGEIIDIGVANSGSLIANIPGSAYSVKLDNCTVPWVKIG
jgi:hypothetical protein